MSGTAPAIDIYEMSARLAQGGGVLGHLVTIMLAAMERGAGSD